MTKRRRRQTAPPRRPPVRRPSGASVSTPGLLELDRFSEADLQRWRRYSKDLDELNNILYLGVEPQRRRRHDALVQALQSVPCDPMDFTGWARILPWCYSDAPLSAAGSLRAYGGRFNIGMDVDNAIPRRWPALYIAENKETAYRERFGLSKEEGCDGLTSNELALTDEDSYSVVRMNGHLERVFSVAQAAALDPICEVLAEMTLPAEARQIMKRLKIDARQVGMIRSPERLLREVLEVNWRRAPVQFGVPSSSQILASLIVDAGYEGIRYPSTKNGGECVAIFPHRLASDASFVSVSDAPPSGVKWPRLDLTTANELCGWEIVPNELRAAKD